VVESDGNLIEGISGVDTDIVGTSGKFIVGIDGESGRFIVGTEEEESRKLKTGTETGALFTWIEGVSGS
jgi:hypothetical protein